MNAKTANALAATPVPLSLDVQTGAAKEAAGVRLDDYAMIFDVAELRIRHIEMLLMNPKPAPDGKT